MKPWLKVFVMAARGMLLAALLGSRRLGPGARCRQRELDPGAADRRHHE